MKEKLHAASFSLQENLVPLQEAISKFPLNFRKCAIWDIGMNEPIEVFEDHK